MTAFKQTISRVFLGTGVLTFILTLIFAFQNCSSESNLSQLGSSELLRSDVELTEPRLFQGAGGTDHSWLITYSPALDMITVTGSWVRRDNSFAINSGSYPSVTLSRGQTGSFNRTGFFTAGQNFES